MSLTIKGATSGSVDVVAPASGSDVTLTLPTTTATVETTASSIASSRLTGALPAVSGASLTSLTSGNLTGALPAISGALLTNLPAGGVDGIASSANATAITIQSDEKVRISTDPNATAADGSVLTVNHYNTANTLPLVILGGANSLSPANTYLGLGFGYGSATGYVSAGVLSEFKDTAARMDIHLCTKSSGAGNVTLSDSKLKVSSYGVVTMPYQPAFNAHMGTAISITANQWDTILFHTERFDQGSNFASNTFTAPITGKYQLSVFLRINNIRDTASYYGLKIATSNKNYEITLGPGGFDSTVNHWPIALDTLADMDANDTAYCSFYQSGGASSAFEAHMCVFSGFLVA